MVMFLVREIARNPLLPARVLRDGAVIALVIGAEALNAVGHKRRGLLSGRPSEPFFDTSYRVVSPDAP